MTWISGAGRARAALGTLAGLMLAIAIAVPAAADVDDFAFDGLTVDVALSRDGDGAGVARITETFVAVFPDVDQNRGMQRRLPLDDEGVPLHPTLVSVTDERGGQRPAETETDDGELIITSAVPEGEFVHGRQTYVFTYTLDNVAGAKDSGVDEFYWNLLGAEWSQPFGAVEVAVTVDASLADALTGDARSYAGDAGSTDSAVLEPARQPDGSVRFEARAEDVRPHQAVTFAIGFEPGTFTPFDASVASSPAALAQIGGGVLGAVALVWAVLVRRRRLRDDPGRPVVIAEYDPPSGIDAATAAAILGHAGRIVPAEILEQAVNGTLRIIASQGFLGTSKFTAELIDPRRADENGRIILKGLFGDDLRPGETFVFGTTSTRFSTAAHRLMSWAGARNRSYRRGTGFRFGTWPVILAIAGLVVTVGAGVAALLAYVTPLVPILLLIFGSLAFVGVLVILARNPLTSEGAEIRDHLRGLEQFIAWAEEDRIRMLQSPHGAERRPVDVNDPREMLVLYERLLPFAVVFGQEKQWAERLAVMYPGDSPGWYVGSGPLNASAFAASISAMSSASSSSGGSSGGGSAGGGGGGGGGGGV
ncbi:DUF2207 domain-containing protein [Microbacterium rhizophilus]|uniref:DUF2207 domain-containing protein n=1 Tax=Microbacterium rhizophilus TaxID=3138934 RepID=UPI0031F05EA5